MDTTTQNEYIDYLKNVRLSEKILDDVKEEHFYRGKQIGIQNENTATCIEWPCRDHFSLFH